MTNYKEIVTKAVISKAKKLFTTNHQIAVDNPSTILGCWVINHQFHGSLRENCIVIEGSYDVNIWYSYDNDTKTNVVKQTNTYNEVIHMRNRENDHEEVIVRGLKQPSCVKAYLEDNQIHYIIEKELGIELVGDIKVKVEVNGEEDPWDEITSDDIVDEKDDSSISQEIHDDFINENTI